MISMTLLVSVSMTEMETVFSLAVNTVSANAGAVPSTSVIAVVSSAFFVIARSPSVETIQRRRQYYGQFISSLDYSFQTTGRSCPGISRLKNTAVFYQASVSAQYANRTDL